MSYRAGMGALLANTLGVRPGEAFIYCDTCGRVQSTSTKRGDVAQWVLKRRAPPGWLLIRREQEDGTIYRRDYCPACKGLPRAEGGG